MPTTSPETPIEIVEVGPRDGFQAEGLVLPTSLKVEVLRRLAASGLRRIEVTSFVSPRVVPQMADAAEVMAAAREIGGLRRLALVPNLRGAQRALAAGAEELRLVICATETYNQRNVGLSVAESLETFRRVAALAEGEGATASAVLAAAFGCPFEGPVAAERVVELSRELVAMGSAWIGLGDSAGVGDPRQVRELVAAVREALAGSAPIWLHLHDTRGLGLANALAALEEGVRCFDTSLGGLGGCPIVRGATGNVATEDFVHALGRLGLTTGVDLDGVREASRRLEDFLGRRLPSRVLQAGTWEEMVARNREVGNSKVGG